MKPIEVDYEVELSLAKTDDGRFVLIDDDGKKGVDRCFQGNTVLISDPNFVIKNFKGVLSSLNIGKNGLTLATDEHQVYRQNGQSLIYLSLL